MKQTLKKQKSLSALMALSLAAVITLFAASNSFGVPNSEYIMVDDSSYKLELIAEVVKELEKEEFRYELDEIEYIKIYDAQNKLINTITLEGDEVIESQDLKKLIYTSEFLSTYGNTSIYRQAE